MNLLVICFLSTCLLQGATDHVFNTSVICLPKTDLPRMQNLADYENTQEKKRENLPKTNLCVENAPVLNCSQSVDFTPKDVKEIVAGVFIGTFFLIYTSFLCNC